MPIFDHNLSPEEAQSATCPECEETFTKKARQQKYCLPRCRVKAGNRKAAKKKKEKARSGKNKERYPGKPQGRGTIPVYFPKKTRDRTGENRSEKVSKGNSMKKIKTKSMVVMMTYMEVIRYILGENNRFHIPDANEAELIDDAKHPSFWISEVLGDRRVVYNKKEQCFVRVHPIMKHHVVLIYEKEKG